MTTYKEREEELFARWMEACRVKDGINPEEDFAYDGILFRGELELLNGRWIRHSGNETELWDNATCRLLILTKDTTRNGGQEDIREEAALKNNIGDRKEPAAGMYRNLTLWSYALLNAVQGGEIVEYNQTPCWDELREHYASAPIARVNCKKEIGESSIRDEVLKAHIERYADLLQEQIAMYDADIILCCGGGGIIKDFVKNTYLPDLEKFSDAGWVYFSPSTQKIVIDSYHPSYPKSHKDIELYYEQMMADLKAFLRIHPEYHKSKTYGREI